MFGRRRFGRRRPPCYPVPGEEDKEEGVMRRVLRTSVEKASSLLGLGNGLSGPGGDNKDVLIDGLPIPLVLLAEIFKRIDDNVTVGCICPLVCSRWNEVLSASGFWIDYSRYHAWLLPPPGLRSIALLNMKKTCLKRPFGNNLVRNPSGQDGFKHWTIVENGGDNIRVESPPKFVTANLDEDIPVAFATSYRWGKMEQVIDLYEAGIEAAFLDTYCPPIKVSESFNCRKDCASTYVFIVKLVAANQNPEIGGESWFEMNWTRQEHPPDEDEKSNTGVLCVRHMEQWTNAEWQCVEHTFDNYPKGIRYVVLGHAGCDGQFWAGHYGAKMANASVVVGYGDGIQTGA